MIELLFILFIFRDFVGKYIPYGEYYFIIVALVLLLIKIYSNRSRNPFVFITYFNVYLLILIFPSFIQVGIAPTLIGILNLSLFLNFIHLNHTIDKARIDRCLKFTALLLSVGTIIQFFIHPTIFGLISENLFTNKDVLANLNFTKRGISFIKSPQTLGFVLSLFLMWSNSKNLVFRILIFTAGILTFSKSFFFPIFLYYLYRNIKAGIIVLPILTGFLLYFGVFELSGFERILNIPKFLEGFLESDRFLAYSQFFNKEYYPQWFLGNGLGALSRGAEIYTNGSLLSSESFLLQILYETGIIGLILILMTFYQIYSKLDSGKEFMSISLLVSIFTPSLYGFSASLIFYSIIKSELANGIFNPNECLPKRETEISTTSN